MLVRRFRALALATLAVAAAAPLLAAPADTVRTRVAGLREVGAAFKAINDGLRGNEPQLVLIRQSAREIRNAARAQYTWFPAGSGPQAGVKTAAKPEIWTQAQSFKAAQDAFATQANAFHKAAAGTDVAKIRAAAKKLGATCKGCHDSFRTEKK